MSEHPDFRTSGLSTASVTTAPGRTTKVCGKKLVFGVAPDVPAESRDQSCGGRTSCGWSKGVADQVVRGPLCITGGSLAMPHHTSS